MSGQHPPSAEPADGDRITLAHDRAQIDRLHQTVLASLERHGYEEASRFAVRLALEEGISNAFRHGHASLDADLPIDVEWSVDADRIVMVIEDQGPGFNPDVIPDPTLEENLEKPAGRGVLLIRSFMSEVAFEGRGNRLRMVFKRGQPTPHA